MSAVTMKELLESGVHFGHQTRRWNPRMKPYIFTERGGIYIIDLQKTTKLIDKAYDFIKNLAENGKKVLFVGTKKQCQDTIAEEAERAGMPYVSHRWLGGLLTNYNTISKRIKRLHELRQLKEDGQLELLPTREQMNMLAELKKLETNLGGVADMDKLPQAVLVIDTKRETIVIREARKLGIPIIALVDTNCDPDEVDYVIPGNDDAIRSCGVIIRAMAEAVVEGKQLLTEKELAAGRAAAEEARKQAEANEKKKAAEEARKQAEADGKKKAAEEARKQAEADGKKKDGAGEKAAPKKKEAKVAAAPAARKEADSETDAPAAAKKNTGAGTANKEKTQPAESGRRKTGADSKTSEVESGN
ncbi:30S ribosomal protein S2 [bacterium BMS3Abin01]|nr:30S ribosomal protein S2 [bacterium BMS3Abin01]